MILEGLYSEALHFISAFALAWVVLSLIRVIFSISLPKDKLIVALLMVWCFGVGSLLHLLLDSLQSVF
jgi:hypothetical protein